MPMQLCLHSQGGTLGCMPGKYITCTCACMQSQGRPVPGSLLHTLGPCLLGLFSPSHQSSIWEWLFLGMKTGRKEKVTPIGGAAAHRKHLACTETCAQLDTSLCLKIFACQVFLEFSKLDNPATSEWVPYLSVWCFHISDRFLSQAEEKRGRISHLFRVTPNADSHTLTSTFTLL